MTLPELLLCSDGQPVTTAALWESVRRPELLELFTTQVFGRTPDFDPPSFALLEERSALDETALRRDLRITYGRAGRTGHFDCILFLPMGAQRAPALIVGANRFPQDDPARDEEVSKSWPVRAITARGMATAFFYYGDVDSDEDDGFTSGVHRLCPEPRTPESWGTIAAWAWGYSRVLDCLETQPEIDPARVAAVGHSRGGKTALWAAARDTRFLLACSNNSGCTGAALSRGNRGEQVRDINTVFPYWFCENYHRYNEDVDALPVDQHMLLSLIAPRRLYVASATEDGWADPAGEFAGWKAAADAFRLYGEEPAAGGEMPAPDSPLTGTCMAYHLRTGGHALTEYDWQRYMDFLER